ncbi:hypothetical protein BB405_27980 (plasmid) [Escherichia coli]|nr:hypothetical protein BB405_27980 [Escherichia coli]
MVPTLDCLFNCIYCRYRRIIFFTLGGLNSKKYIHLAHFFVANVCLLTRTGNIILRLENEKTDKVYLPEVLLVIGIMVMVIPKFMKTLKPSE